MSRAHVKRTLLYALLAGAWGGLALANGGLTPNVNKTGQLVYIAHPNVNEKPSYNTSTPTPAPPVAQKTRQVIYEPNAHITADMHKKAQKSNISTPTPTIIVPTPEPTQQPGYLATCWADTPAAVPAQGSCATPEGSKYVEQPNDVCYPKGDPSGIVCWNVKVRPSVATPGSYDYFCTYMGIDGGVIEDYRETLPTNDQGLTCKP